MRTGGALSQKTAKLMVFTLVRAASKTSRTWRRLNGTNQLPSVIAGVKFTDGGAHRHAIESRAARRTRVTQIQPQLEYPRMRTKSRKPHGRLLDPLRWSTTSVPYHLSARGVRKPWLGALVIVVVMLPLVWGSLGWVLIPVYLAVAAMRAAVVFPWRDHDAPPRKRGPGSRS